MLRGNFSIEFLKSKEYKRYTKDESIILICSFCKNLDQIRRDSYSANVPIEVECKINEIPTTDDSKCSSCCIIS